MSFLHLRAFFPASHPNANLGSEIPANYQGVSKIPSGAAGFWCVHGNIYKHRRSDKTKQTNKTVCACFSTWFLPYRDSSGNHSLSPKGLLSKYLADSPTRGCNRRIFGYALVHSNLQPDHLAWGSYQSGTEAQKNKRDATLETCKKAGGAETKRGNKE